MSARRVVAGGTLLGLLVAACLAAPAGAAISLGTSGWHWDSPTPRGAQLKALSFAGMTGYAAGQAGLILRSTDGGSSWSSRSVGTLDDLEMMQAIDANTAVTSDGCNVWRTGDAFASTRAIFRLPLSTCGDNPVVAVTFASPTDGYVLRQDGTLLATTDGGAHLERRATVPGLPEEGEPEDPPSIAFADRSTGLVGTTGGRLYRTTDGARSWHVVDSGRLTIHRVLFASATRAYAIGDGIVLRSDDAGQTWASNDLGLPFAEISAIACGAPEHCIFTFGEGNDTVLTTNDGATSVRLAKTPKLSPSIAGDRFELPDVAFASPTRAVAIGNDGRIELSDDGGASFRLLDDPIELGAALDTAVTPLVAGVTRGTAFALGHFGPLARTTDAGRSWQVLNRTIGSRASALSFATASVGYAVQFPGTVYRTRDGGRSWQLRRRRRPSPAVGPQPPSVAIATPSTRDVVLVGLGGVSRSTNAGRSFAHVRGRAVAHLSLTGIAWARRMHLIAWGPHAILRSRTGGRTWTRMAIPHVTLDTAAFASASLGLLVDSSGRLWRTTNGGRHWTRLLGYPRERASQLSIASRHDAYATTADGLLHSRDGGATWAPELLGYYAATADGGGITPAVLATGTGTDYLFVGDTGLLSTTSGGLTGKRAAVTLTTARRRLRKPGTIRITGRLHAQHAGGAVLSFSSSAIRPGQGPAPQFESPIVVAADGSFSFRATAGPGATTFVVNWPGDGRLAAAGSRALTVQAPGQARRAKPPGPPDLDPS